MDLIFLEPVFKEMIWGGNRLKSEFGYDIPSDHTGECWAISAHPGGDCLIKNGENKGKTLSWLWDHKRELFGHMTGDRYPLLVKIIDAKDDLSIQVHPNDSYAKEHENGSLGKTECWYVLDCDRDAEIVIGHYAKDQREMEQMVEEQRWDEFIRKVPIKKGDFFQINPGCLHAIKGGTMILETQQNSDITYRVYDYDRIYQGNPRELHIAKSLDVLQAPFEEINVISEEINQETYQCSQLVTCRYYTVWKYNIHGKASFTMSNSFLNISIIDGEGLISGTPVRKGDHLMLPYGFGDYTVEGDFSYIASAKER